MERPDTERMIEIVRSSAQAAGVLAVGLKVISEAIGDLAKAAKEFADKLQQLESGDTLTPSAKDSTKGES